MKREMAWWHAGKISTYLETTDWNRAALRAAELVAPRWPTDGSSSWEPVNGMTTLALLLYALHDDPWEVPTEELVERLRDHEGLPAFLAKGLGARGHQVDAADDRLAKVYRQLVAKRSEVPEPMVIPMDMLPSTEQPKLGGTDMSWGVGWVLFALVGHPKDPVFGTLSC